MKRFSYHDYATTIRNPEVVENHLANFRPYFKQCKKIIDIGCGEGFFIKHLAAVGQVGVGIDSNPDMASELNKMGFKVYFGSAVDIWPNIEESFDGAFCSHLIEHLPFESIIDLVEGLSQKLLVGARVVFAWPNPGSLEMQLFHFWRDPEHVRYYDQFLIAGLFEHYGLKIDECFSQGPWGMDKPTKFILPYSSNVLKRDSSVERLKKSNPFKQKLKNILGINRLNKETNYIEYMRSQGRELVLVATKQ